MYLMGALDWHIDRHIGRHSPEHRSILDRVSTDVSTDSPLTGNDTHGVSWHIDRDTVSGISVNYRLYIGQVSTEYRSTVGQHLFSLKVQLQLTSVNKYLNAFNKTHW